MGERIVLAIVWLLLKLEARMVTFMIWLCWIFGITSDDVDRFRDQHKGDARPTSVTNNPRFPPEPRLPSKIVPLPKRML